MLRSIHDLNNYILAARDGEIGRCKDFLFDDRHWAVRYMVADTGKWLPGRKVLISPLSLEQPDWSGRRFPVNLTKEQIEGSPPLDRDAPVSRRYEMRYMSYYGGPHYWQGTNIWGHLPYPPVAPLEPSPGGFEDKELEPDEVHLRSTEEVSGYSIRAEDGDMGRVSDFIVEDGSWVLRYMVVDTRKWLPGRKVLISPEWIGQVSWPDSAVDVTMDRESVKNSPPYDPTQPVNRQYEAVLYDYYGRPHYWEDQEFIPR
jgi:hypothetical protein